MNLEYIDIFYHHRPNPNTPLEETMGALDYIVRSGKALYTGHLLLSAQPDSTGGKNPSLSWDSVPDSSAEIQHV